MEELMMVNPELLRYRKRFIRWEGLEDTRLFEMLLGRNVYINGFINDNYAGLKWYNKPFVTEESTDKEKDTCIIAQKKMKGGGRSEPDAVLEAFVLNPCIQNRPVMIYGSGHNGREALKYLEKSSVKVLGFIDSNPKRWGERIQGYEIFAPDRIESLNWDTVVVLAAQQYHQMEKTVRHYSTDLTVLYSDCSGISLGGRTAGFYDLGFLCKSMCDKNHFVYGTSDKLEICVNIFQMLDFSVQGILSDSADKNEDQLFSLKVRPAEEILYEENAYVWICSEDEDDAIKRLDSLGLEAVEDYMVFGSFRRDRFRYRKQILDINLGYTYISKDGDYGLSKLKARQEEKYKIVVLGGSTTDGELYTFRSWPECLWSKLDTDFISVYNYGVAGYTSGQELVRLIRDVIETKPDMILVFDGVNNFMKDPEEIKNSLSFSYLGSVMHFAGKHLHDLNIDRMDISDRAVYGGETVYSDNFSEWLANVKMMHAIAELYQIPFINFLQPVLSDKFHKSIEEMFILEEYCKYIERKSFRDSFAGLKEKPDYIIDLSDLFDDISGIYMDICHVNERGNQIIADKIYNVIKPILQSWELQS